MFMVELSTDNYYAFFGISPDATAAEIRDAQDTMKDKVAREIESTRDKEAVARLEEKLKEIGKKGNELKRPEMREAYDRSHADLRFLVVRPCAVPLFSSRADRPYVIDRIVRRFLADKGASIEPLCDLDRNDFTHEWSPAPLLDALLEE